MVESYNRVITLLLLVALAVTFLGTVVTYNSILEKQGKSVSWLSGAATSTSTGQTNLTITSSTSITNQNFVIQFGSGNVNSTCDFCQMDTNGVSYSIYTSLPNATGGGCCGTWNYTQTAGFLLENTGNNNISVGYTCSGNCTHASFIGGTLFLGMGGLEIKVTSNSVAAQGGEAGTLDSAASCVGGGCTGAEYRGVKSWNITNSSAYGGALDSAGYGEAYYVPLGPRHWLCGNSTMYPLSSDNTKDAAVVDVNITIPASAPAGGVQSSFTLTFNGTAAG